MPNRDRRMWVLVCCTILAGLHLCFAGDEDGLQKMKDLSYDGTEASLQEIQDAVKASALSQNLIALNIYRQTMYGLGQIVPLANTPGTSSIAMNDARRAAIVPWVKMVQDKASAGDAFYQTVFGVLYNFGEGVPKDKAKALEWWKKAAVKYHDANYKIGTYYAQDPEHPDYAKGLEYFGTAAAMGGSMSLYNLGCFYHQGDHGVKQDDKKSLEYWEAAAEKGHSTAQRNVGLCYLNGVGAEINYAKAKKWFEKAAESGDEGGRMLLKEHFSVSSSPRPVDDPGRPVHSHGR